MQHCLFWRYRLGSREPIIFGQLFWYGAWRCSVVHIDTCVHVCVLLVACHGKGSVLSNLVLQTVSVLGFVRLGKGRALQWACFVG